ncbi:MAG: DUF2950 family protein [Planctomycetota bacterium]|jgi:hypothetical protein
MVPPEADENPDVEIVYRSPPTSGFAIASLVCAFLCMPVGFILGIVAMVLIGRSEGRLGGMGLAIAGTVLSAVIGFMCLPITAAIMIPALLHARVGANEASARASLKQIHTGQGQFQAARCVDQDKDGIGEYGFLMELGGLVIPRNELSRRGSWTVSPYISRLHGTVDANGGSQKNGYCFKIYLPGPDGTVLEETDKKLPEVDPRAADGQEKRYLLYAWPAEAGRTGLRTFAIDPQGRIYEKLKTRFSGPSNPPPWDEALQDSNGNGKLDWDDELGGKGWASSR